MDELIAILYKMNPKFIFKPIHIDGFFTYNMTYFTPTVPTKEIFIELNVDGCDKKILEDSFIYNSFHKPEWQKILFKWMQQKIEYKFRLQQ